MSSQSVKQISPVNIACVSVGVADMNAVRRLWVDELGLDVIDRRRGPDAELARLWNIPAEQIVEQLLLGTPGAASGRLHFVQFREPEDAVRKGAAPTDLGAKNLDVNCTDMPALVARLRAAGYAFRSEIGEYDIDGITAREVQMPVHDDVNVVLIEVLTKGFEVEYTAAGFAALTSFVVIVPDVEREIAFYQQLFGMQNILSHKLSGPAIEMAAGLPAGTVLDLHLLGGPDNLFGRMELIEYVGVNGANCFTRAVPPATGILRCGFAVASLDEFAALALEHAVPITRSLEVDVIFAKGKFLQLSSPAGLQIEIYELT
jgi:catechol 2,3-dioxygenase-like lactoylglutathione lyase family enzyme